MNFIRHKFSIYITLLLFLTVSSVKSEEEEIQIQAVADQIQVLIKDLKTLEKAVYQKSDVTSKNLSSINSTGLNEDILTKHLLKLNEIEDQFRELTNKFEEVNFKLDKLSSRVTKIQSDNQLRFSDLENLNPEVVKKNSKSKKNYRDLVSLLILEQTLVTQFQACRKNKKLIQ